MKSINFVKGSFVILPNVQVAMKLRGATLPIYIAICKYADDNGRGWPSYKRLTEDTGYDERMCQRAMNELVGTGLITKVPRVRLDGSQTSNMYQIQVVTSVSPPLDMDVTPPGKDVTPPPGKDVTPPGDTDAAPLNYTHSELNLTNSNNSGLPAEAEQPDAAQQPEPPDPTDHRGEYSPAKERLRERFRPRPTETQG